MRRDRVAGQHDLHRARFAHDARPALRAAAARDDADVDLRLPELRRLRGDDHVARERQFAAAAVAVTADGGDDRLARPPHRAQDGRVEAVKHARCATWAHLLDVRAGAEGLVVAGDDDAAHVGALLELLQGLRGLALQLCVERVEHLRAVQLNHAHIRLDAADNRFNGHHDALAFRHPLELCGVLLVVLHHQTCNQLDRALAIAFVLARALPGRFGQVAEQVREQLMLGHEHLQQVCDRQQRAERGAMLGLVVVRKLGVRLDQRAANAYAKGKQVGVQCVRQHFLDRPFAFTR